MGVISVKGSRVVFQKRDEIAVLEPWGKDCLRFRSTPNSTVADENWNLLVQPETKCSINADEEKATIVNGKISAEIYKNGKVVYYKTGRNPHRTLRNGVFSNTGSIGRWADNHRATVIFEPNEHEHFYGLGQEQNGCLT